jgi:hypothetical protein
LACFIPGLSAIQDRYLNGNHFKKRKQLLKEKKMGIRTLLSVRMVFLFVFLVGFAVGCGDDSTDTPVALSEVDLIQSSITGNTDTESILSAEAFSDGDLASSVGGDVEFKPGDSLEAPLYHQSLGTSTHPHWFRTASSTSRVITPLQDGNKVNVTFMETRNGLFHIDVDGTYTTDSGFGKKVFSHVGTRYATFETSETATSTKDRRKLIEVSPLEISLATSTATTTTGTTTSTLQTVKIKEAKALSGTTTRFVISNPALKIAFPGGLATFASGEKILVTATVENGDSTGTRTSRVFLHHDGKRRKMFDNGTEGDKVANDRIFSREVMIGAKTGLMRVLIDAIDAKVFSDETTQNYNAAGWIIPYSVTGTSTATTTRQ